MGHLTRRSRQRLRRWDERLLQRVSGAGAPTVDRALAALSWSADRSKLWLGLAAVLSLAGGPSGRRAAARGLVSVLLASAFVNGPAKLLFRRARPSPARTSRLARLVKPPRTASFPSGHSASAFAFATGAGLEARALLAPLAVVAAAVAVSRLRARVHYPSDVVVGAAVGIAAGVAGGRVLAALDRRRTRPAARGAPARTSIPMPELAVLVTSPNARRARYELAAARRALTAAGIQVVAEVPVTEAAALTGFLRPDRPAPLVIAAGGDGTVGAVAGRIASSPAIMGVIPLGTSNDFARSLGIPIDVRRAAALLRAGKVSTVDLGRFVGPDGVPRHFVHAATAGLNVSFARLATRASLRRRLGRFTYAVAAAAALRERHVFRCRISYGERSEELELEELAVINAPVFGGFLGLRLGGSELDDRRLDVLAVEVASLWRLPLAALFAVLGVRRRVRGVRALHVPRLRVHTDSPLAVTLDGEVLGTLPADFEVAGEALRVVTPLDFEDVDDPA